MRKFLSLTLVLVVVFTSTTNFADTAEDEAAAAGGKWIDLMTGGIQTVVSNRTTTVRMKLNTPTPILSISTWGRALVQFTRGPMAMNHTTHFEATICRVNHSGKKGISVGYRSHSGLSQTQMFIFEARDHSNQVPFIRGAANWSNHSQGSIYMNAAFNTRDKYFETGCSEIALTFRPDRLLQATIDGKIAENFLDSNSQFTASDYRGRFGIWVQDSAMYIPRARVRYSPLALN